MPENNLQLPKTAFSMKANLPSKEPKILESWDKTKLYERLRKKSAGKEKFILHDGPPYANGHIHMVTPLNKICNLYFQYPKLGIHIIHFLPILSICSNTSLGL